MGGAKGESKETPYATAAPRAQCTVGAAQQPELSNSDWVASISISKHPAGLVIDASLLAHLHGFFHFDLDLFFDPLACVMGGSRKFQSDWCYFCGLTWGQIVLHHHGFLFVRMESSGSHRFGLLCQLCGLLLEIYWHMWLILYMSILYILTKFTLL